MFKKKMFKKIVLFLNNISNKNNEYIDYKTNIFAEYIGSLILEEGKKLKLLESSRLCNKALHLAEKKLKYINEIEKIQQKIKELEYIESLTKEDIAQLNKIVYKYKNLRNEGMFLQRQIGGFSTKLDEMKGMITNSKTSVSIIEDMEKKHRMFKSDIRLLKTERSILAEEREVYINAIHFTNKLTMTIIIVFSFLMVILAFLKVFNDAPIFYPTFLITVALLIFIPGTYIFKLKSNKEIKKINMKQKRAVELINKKTSVFAYYTSFLNFTYKKYGENNARDIKDKISKYKEYKKVEQRKDRTDEMLLVTSDALVKFIEEKNIPHSSSLDNFVKHISIENKKEELERLEKNKSKNIEIIKILKLEHEKQWSILLSSYNENDVDERDVFNNLLKIYYEELELASQGIQDGEAVRIDAESTTGENEIIETIEKKEKEEVDEVEISKNYVNFEEYEKLEKQFKQILKLDLND